MPYDKIYKPMQVDCLVCTEFPNENEDPLLFSLFWNTWLIVHTPLKDVLTDMVDAPNIFPGLSKNIWVWI